MSKLLRATMIILCLGSSALSVEIHYINIGKVYDFAEKDMLQEIQDYIQNNQIQIQNRWHEASIKMKDKATNYKPHDLPKLPQARKNSIFYPNMNYTLDIDIPDKDGKIIYPKGYTFNPMNYVNLPYTIIVINAMREEEVDWLKKQKITNTAYRVFLTDGSYIQVAKELKMPVFYCMPKIASRFKLKATPSVIMQEGHSIKVKEICLKDCE